MGTDILKFKSVTNTSIYKKMFLNVHPKKVNILQNQK